MLLAVMKRGGGSARLGAGFGVGESKSVKRRVVRTWPVHAARTPRSRYGYCKEDVYLETLSFLVSLLPVSS